MARLQEAVPNPTPKVKLEDSTSIIMPSEEEQVKEQQVQGLLRKQHYAQYVQAACRTRGRHAAGGRHCQGADGKGYRIFAWGSSP